MAESEIEASRKKYSVVLVSPSSSEVEKDLAK